MANGMHIPLTAPHCWMDPQQHDPRTLPIRQDWSIDGAAACGGATTDPDRGRLIAHDPQCEGCARLSRAILIDDGKIAPHPHRIGRAARQMRQECGLWGGELPAEPEQLEAAHGAASETEA